MLKRWSVQFLVILSLFSSTAFAAVPAWMLAPWDSPAPHLKDLGYEPTALAKSIDRRLVVLAHAPRDITVPSAKGARFFPKARFVSAVSRVDIPAATLRRRLQNFTDYRSLFPLVTQSTVEAMEGNNVVSRYRVEIPLPALGNFTIDVRVKNKIEEDGSISVMLLDGKAESLLAILGGATDELAGQPVVIRWEVVPVSARQSLLVMTYWDQVRLKSFFARKIDEIYPELNTIRPYMVAAGSAEALHRLFSNTVLSTQEAAPPGKSSFDSLNAVLAEGVKNGPALILEPEQVVLSGKKSPLRYATVAYPIAASVPLSRTLSTRYSRLVESQKELKNITVKERERGADLGLEITVSILLLRISVDLDLATNWEDTDRLEFHRTAGQIARLRAAAEWHPLQDEQNTLMFVTIGHELGNDAPFFLRMAHRITEQVPYADTLGMALVQMVAMERMKKWVEKQTPPKADQ